MIRIVIEDGSGLAVILSALAIVISIASMVRDIRGNR